MSATVGTPATVCWNPSDISFGFNSMWRSPATGLVYMRNRWYSPRLAQFTTHDPLGAVDSANLYAFAGFDPINGWDPWGLKASGHAETTTDSTGDYQDVVSGYPEFRRSEAPERPLKNRVGQLWESLHAKPEQRQSRAEQPQPRAEQMPADEIVPVASFTFPEAHQCAGSNGGFWCSLDVIPGVGAVKIGRAAGVWTLQTLLLRLVRGKFHVPIKIRKETAQEQRKALFTTQKKERTLSRHDPERSELPSFDIVRLACTQALVGEVIPEMLGATVGYSNDEIHFIIYYDRDLTEELEENLADIAVTIEAYFFPVLRLNIEGKVARERADLVPLKCWVFLLKLVDGDELIRFPRGK